MLDVPEVEIIDNECDHVVVWIGLDTEANDALEKLPGGSYSVICTECEYDSRRRKIFCEYHYDEMYNMMSSGYE